MFTMADNQREQQPPPLPPRPDRLRACFICGSQGHLARACPRGNNQRANPRGQRLVANQVNEELQAVRGQLAAAREVNRELRENAEAPRAPHRARGRSRPRNGRHRENSRQRALREQGAVLAAGAPQMLPDRPTRAPIPPVSVVRRIFIEAIDPATQCCICLTDVTDMYLVCPAIVAPHHYHGVCQSCAPAFSANRVEHCPICRSALGEYELILVGAGDENNNAGGEREDAPAGGERENAPAGAAEEEAVEASLVDRRYPHDTITLVSEDWRSNFAHIGTHITHSIVEDINAEVEFERPLRHSYEQRPRLVPDFKRVTTTHRRYIAFGGLYLLGPSTEKNIIVSGALISELGSRAAGPEMTSDMYRSRIVSDANRLPHLRADAQYLTRNNVIANSADYLVTKRASTATLKPYLAVLGTTIAAVAGTAAVIGLGLTTLYMTGFFHRLFPRDYTITAYLEARWGSRRFGRDTVRNAFYPRPWFKRLSVFGREYYQHYGGVKDTILDAIAPRRQNTFQTIFRRPGTGEREWKHYEGFKEDVHDLLTKAYRMMPRLMPTALCEKKHGETGRGAMLVTMAAVGYRVYDALTGEVAIEADKDNNSTKVFSFKFRPGAERIHNERKPICGVNPFFHVEGVFMPSPDPEPMNQLAGLVHRIARSPHANVDPDYIMEIGEWFVGALPRFVAPIERAMTFDEYLDGRPWTRSKKDAFRKLHVERSRDNAMRNMNRVVWSCFTKFEFYPSFKNARGIYGVGRKTYENDYLYEYSRYIKSIEREIYPRLPGTVKELTMKGRADMARQWGDDTLKGGSDYSAFESGFTIFVMVFIMIPFLAYMTCAIDDQPLFMRAVWRMYTAENIFEFSTFIAVIYGCNTSGTSSTALKNLIFNWAVWGYSMVKYYKMPPEVAFEKMMLEGDDNKNDLQAFPIPSIHFEKAGLYTKMETNVPNSEMAFCQQYVLLMTDTSVRDPRCIVKAGKVLLRYCGAKRKTMLELLRAQALSWKEEANGSPVITVLARKLMQMTKGIYVRESILEAVLPYHVDSSAVRQTHDDFKPITNEARELVEEVFSFPVHAQLECEAAIERWDFGPLKLPLEFFPDHWLDCWNAYVVPFQREVWFTYAHDDDRLSRLVARLEHYRQQ